MPTAMQVVDMSLPEAERDGKWLNRHLLDAPAPWLSVKYWDRTIQFHTLVAKDTPRHLPALDAMRYLRSVLEPIWREEYAASHPLRSRLEWAGEPNDSWIHYLARKMKLAASIPGF